MRNLFETGVAKTKEEKLFVLNTMLSDFAEDNVIPKYTSQLIANAVTNNYVIKYSYVIRKDIGEIGFTFSRVIDFQLSIYDEDMDTDIAYFSLLAMQDSWFKREQLADDGEIDKANGWFIKLPDFLKEINLL